MFKTMFVHSCYFSIAHGGKSDIKDHIVTAKHRDALKSASSSKQLTTYFTTNKCEERNVAAAEATFAFHSVRHHHSYNSTTCTSKLFSEMFSDSKIAKTFSSAKTKTEAIVNNVISPLIQAELKENLSKSEFVGISTDASNHKYHKIFPVIVQFFDKVEGIQSKMVDIVECQNENSDTVSDVIHNITKQNYIEDKISSFGGDNTNTNFGGLARRGENNVFTKLKCKLGRSIVGVGCPVHILHNSLQVGADSLSVDVQTIIVKVYNYFSIYTVRVASLMEYCEFVNVTYEDLLNHVKTRWLSLFPAIERFLHMFQPLKSYFMSQDKCPVLLKSFFSSEVGEAYFWFLMAQMSLFQKSIARIEMKHISVNEVKAILLDIIGTLKERKDAGFVSIKVKDLLVDLPESQYVKFHNECMSFYDSVIDYLLKWSEPLTELNHFDWILLQKPVEWTDVEKSFKWLDENSTCKLNESSLFDQVVKLKCFVKENTSNTEFNSSLASTKWTTFFESCISEEQYSELLKIVQFYFSLPGHNANVERVFSLMNAHWTEDRSRLSLASIRAILDIQYNMSNISCSEFYKLITSTKMSKYLDSVKSSEKYDWYKKI